MKKKSQVSKETIKLINNNIKPTSTIPASLYQKNHTIYLIVNAKPNSKVSQIQSIDQQAIGINIAAVPKQGQANQQLIQFLSDLLGLKKTHLSLDKGSKSRNKVVAIQESGYSLEEIYEIIKNECK